MNRAKGWFKRSRPMTAVASVVGHGRPAFPQTSVESSSLGQHLMSRPRLDGCSPAANGRVGVESEHYRSVAIIRPNIDKGAPTL